MKEVLKQITYDELILCTEEIVTSYLHMIPVDDINDNDFLNAAVMLLCIVFEVTHKQLHTVPQMSQSSMSFVLGVVHSVYSAMEDDNYVPHDTSISTGERTF